MVERNKGRVESMVSQNYSWVISSLVTRSQLELQRGGDERPHEGEVSPHEEEVSPHGGGKPRPHGVDVRGSKSGIFMT